MKRFAISFACLFIPLAVMALGIDSRTSGRLTLAANTSGRNCIKWLDLTTGSTGTLRILLGGTTSYIVDLSSASGMIREWDRDQAPCTANPNQIAEVYTTFGAFSLNTFTFLK